MQSTFHQHNWTSYPGGMTHFQTTPKLVFTHEQHQVNYTGLLSTAVARFRLVDVLIDAVL